MENKGFYITVDQKVITWLRETIYVKNVQNEQEAIQKVINSIELNRDIISNEDVHFVETEELYDLDEPLSPDDNGGCSTIEIIDKQHNIIWDNVDGYAEDN